MALPESLTAQEPTPVKPAPPHNEAPLTPTVNADSFAEGFVRTFTPEQFAALKKLGEIIVPSSDDTPGADDAKAAEFLDFLIGQSPADRMQLYRKGLDSLNTEARRLYKRPFAEVSVSEAEPILAPLKQPWSHGPQHFLRAAKSDLLQATVNSREYIAVVSRRRRNAAGSGQYWYAVDREV